MTLRLEVPSKTFLFGEYAVLRGGSAVVLNTEPRFALVATSTPGKKSDLKNPIEGISAESPAGNWLEQRRPLLNEWSVKFFDPHAGRGGFGASSAQFVLLHALTTFLQSSVSRAAAGYDLGALWNDYNVMSRGLGSGADLLAQASGQAAVLEMTHRNVQSKPWPFTDLTFFVARTRSKIATHEHLRNLPTASLEPLVALAEQCTENFRPGQSQVFLDKLKAFAAQLKLMGLQTAETVDLTGKIEKQDWCRLAKGCGAMGADTILILADPSHWERVLIELTTMGLELVGTDRDLSPGLEMKWSWSEN